MTVSIVWLLLIVGVAVFAPVLPIADPLAMQLDRRLVSPDAAYWFGTDNLGRDMFSRALHGARVSVGLGLLVPPVAVVLGLIIGLTAAWYGGAIDRTIVCLVDSYLAFPGLVLYLALVAFVGASPGTLFVVFTLGMTVWFSRLARANALPLVEREFVLAARGLGASTARIVLRELLPNVAVPLLAWSPILASGIIAAEGALSFLGLSVAPPAPTWGNMIEDGRNDLTSAPHAALVPIAMLFSTVLALNIVGEALRRRVDTRASLL